MSLIRIVEFKQVFIRRLLLHIENNYKFYIPYFVDYSMKYLQLDGLLKSLLDGED